MKTTTQPENRSTMQYRPVVFRDVTTGKVMLTRSTAATDKTIEWGDGVTYPLVETEVTSDSHPFYTGRASIVDTAGQVEKFNRRYGRTSG